MTTLLDEIASVHALLGTPGVGYVAAGAALHATTKTGLSLSELLGQPATELLELFPAGMEDAARTIGRCDASSVGVHRRALERFYSAGGQALLVTDADYPDGLRAILGRNAPPVVCVLGNVELLKIALGGIVGARDAAAESLAYARSCAAWFTSEGAGVVSGAANGIDAIAHRTALNEGGSSVFVLPHGILRYRGDELVREALETGHAALVSEFAPEARWASHAALMRNRTIAALSRILCVFEARRTGGSIRTAEAGLAQAKPVLVHCLPGDWRVEQRLVTSGARTLPVDDEAAMREALDTAWHSERPRRKEQQELF